jgi:hypothetical protein
MIDYCNGCDKPLLPGRPCKNCETKVKVIEKQKSIRTVFNSLQEEVMRRAQDFSDEARKQGMTNEEFCKQHLQDSGYLKKFTLKFNNQQKSN